MLHCLKMEARQRTQTFHIYYINTLYVTMPQNKSKPPHKNRQRHFNKSMCHVYFTTILDPDPAKQFRSDNIGSVSAKTMKTRAGEFA